MPAVSRLARLLRAIVFCLAVAAIAWLWLAWDRSPAMALGGAVLIAFGHAWLLVLQFALMVVASRGDPVPTPRLPVLVRAWLREALQAMRIFGWRQAFAWRAEPDPAPAAGRTGIVFIHGFMCNRGFWVPWLRRSRELGIPWATVNLEPVFASIDDYAPQIERAVAALEQGTGRAPVLVCHSMGGLVARAWLRTTRPDRAARVVTIGSPHGGTWIAHFSHVRNGVQMRLGSRWILSLPPPEPARFTCWHTDCDNMVFPPSTAVLPGADNRLVRGLAHVDLAFDHEVMEETLEQVRAL